MRRNTGNTRSIVAGVAVGLVWVGLISAGVRALWSYEGTPGTPGSPPAAWPRESGLARPGGKFTAILFAHPFCSCTLASLSELAGIARVDPARVSLFVVFGGTDPASQSPAASSSWAMAAAIPGSLVVSDPHGREIALFHARVSGQTLLYDAAGRLLFSGGVTAGRGEEGENAGILALMRMIQPPTPVAAAGETPALIVTTPVFGCSLRDPDEKTLREDPNWRR